MERKSVKGEVGFTHADSVNALDKLREFESITVTLWLMPSNSNALPVTPVVHCGPLTRVPVLPLPEESFAVVPDPSSNFQ